MTTEALPTSSEFLPAVSRAARSALQNAGAATARREGCAARSGMALGGRGVDRGRDDAVRSSVGGVCAVERASTGWRRVASSEPMA